jgi:hypothetical protein
MDHDWMTLSEKVFATLVSGIGDPRTRLTMGDIVEYYRGKTTIDILEFVSLLIGWNIKVLVNTTTSPNVLIIDETEYKWREDFDWVIDESLPAESTRT